MSKVKRSIGQPPIKKLRINRNWVLAGTASLGHFITLTAMNVLMLDYLLIYAIIAVPALVTFCCVQGSARRWYRWGTLWFLLFFVHPFALSAVLIVGQTWILHQSWSTEKPTAGHRPFFSVIAAFFRQNCTPSRTS